MKIALDAMGGDLAPKATVEGAVMASRDFGIEVVMVGDAEILAKELSEHDAANLPIRVEHAPEVVLMDDSPLESVLSKPRSSISVGLDLVKRGDASAFVSAGNSGAVMTAAMMILGNLANVDRPAIASFVPNKEGLGLLIDAGANTEVKPINLVQFAVMGSVYWRYLRNVSRPRVGILSNGEEASKGTEITRAAAAMLEKMPTYVNYVGYVEGRDINRSKADVVVTDGFTGNVALKTMEGFASFMLGNLREVFGSNWRSRLAYVLVRKTLNDMRERLDPHEYGGAPLLGVSGVSIIAHGSSNPHAIRNAIRAASNEALVHHVNAEILEILGKIQPAGPVKPVSGKGIRGLFIKMRERLHRREKDAETEKTTEPLAAIGTHEQPADHSHEQAREASHDHAHDRPREHSSDNHVEAPGLEHAKVEAVHAEPNVETVAAVEMPPGQNGTTVHKPTGELRPAEDAKARSPEHPKGDS